MYTSKLQQVKEASEMVWSWITEGAGLAQPDESRIWGTWQGLPVSVMKSSRWQVQTLHSGTWWKITIEM